MAINSEKLVRLLRDGDVMEPLDIQRIKILQRKFDAGQNLSLAEFKDGSIKNSNFWEFWRNWVCPL